MPPPRQIILEALSQRGSLPLDEIARAARRSPLATRYHLGLLVAAGLIVANDAARRGRVGRPQTLYALAQGAHAQLPKEYAWLAAQVLEELARANGEKEARALLRRLGRRLAESAAPRRASARIETRLARAADFLCARGYAARWEKSGDDSTLWVSNCPYYEVAQTQRAVCEIDLALISEMVAAPLRMTHCIVNREAHCAFVIRAR